MYKSYIYSLGLHISMFVFAYFGLPEIKKNKVKEVPIDIVYELPTKKETFVKETSKKQVTKSKRNIKSKSEPIKLAPKPVKPITKLPVVKNKKKLNDLKKKVEKIAKKPTIRPKKAVKQVKAKIEKKQIPKQLPKIIPKRKREDNKKNNKQMSNAILKNLAQAVEKSEKAKKTKNNQQLKQTLMAALNSKDRNNRKKIELGISEIDILRNHVAQCWVTPFTGKDLEMNVDLKINANIDGSVTMVKIMDENKYMKNPVYRAVADSARRAVKDCSPLPLPKGKYELWKAFTFSFDASYLR